MTSRYYISDFGFTNSKDSNHFTNMNAGIFSLIFNFCTYSDQNSDTYLGTYTDYCELVRGVRGVLKKRKNLPTSFMDTKQKE